MYWSIREIQDLKENYGKINRDEIMLLFKNRTCDSVKLKASQLKLSYDNKTKFNRCYFKYKTNINVLTEETPETYYWIGFLMADGHFSTINRLRLTLAEKDLDHLRKFCIYINYDTSFIKYNRKTKSYYMSVMNKAVISILKSKFNISNNKTYNPCLIDMDLDKNLLFSLVIGFIDGDGSIQRLHNRKDVSIGIKCHSSLEENLNKFSEILGFYKKAYINTCNYSQIFFQNNEKLKEIKLKSLNLNLPFMKRKWDIINLDYFTKYEVSSNRVEIYKILKSQGYNDYSIAKVLNINSSSITGWKKRGKI